MKYIKRYCVVFFAIVLLISLVPFQAFAVDPVSASVIANAFAQAIASYGAANGVAMTFDVSSTDGIGESVHELWKDFREGTQTADDYATIAQAIFPELYYKTATAIGTASDVYAVGVHISDTYAETLDDFYNWLLSGPAEMVQVDNAYYEFSQAQIGSEASTINVGSFNSSSWYSCLAPYVASNDNTVIYNNSIPAWTTTNGLDIRVANKSSSASEVYVFYYDTGSSKYPVFVSPQSGSIYYTTYLYEGSVRTSISSTINQFSSDYSLYYQTPYGFNSGTVFHVPLFADLNSGLASLSSYLADPSATVSSIGVKAYNPSGIADIPDTEDPNYDALNRAKDIPLNIPWDDAIYGDGTGTLTDAQSSAIAGDLTQALETDRTVELVEEQDIPIQPDYSDVLLPLIPINVPSFNFSLSGIWHYVRSWVTSLGAWLSMMFSVWGILPYAIVVPVYACLVIVIVLGLYKRFFM